MNALQQPLYEVAMMDQDSEHLKRHWLLPPRAVKTTRTGDIPVSHWELTTFEGRPIRKRLICWHRASLFGKLFMGDRRSVPLAVVSGYYHYLNTTQQPLSEVIMLIIEKIRQLFREPEANKAVTMLELVRLLDDLPMMMELEESLTDHVFNPYGRREVTFLRSSIPRKAWEVRSYLLGIIAEFGVMIVEAPVFITEYEWKAKPLLGIDESGRFITGP